MQVLLVSNALICRKLDHIQGWYIAPEVLFASKLLQDFTSNERWGATFGDPLRFPRTLIEWRSAGLFVQIPMSSLAVTAAVLRKKSAERDATNWSAATYNHQKTAFAS